MIGMLTASMVEELGYAPLGPMTNLADASEVMAGITRRPRTHYAVLVPNEKGMERALAAKVDEVAVFTGASETFVQHNIRTSIAGSIANFHPVADMAREAGVRVRGYISTAFGCPYEGAVAPAAVANVARELVTLGVDELSIGDTIGVATPNQVGDVVDALLAVTSLDQLAMHFHDTRGTALANVLAALELGIAIFDSSSGGLGGCPYAPGASGNLATEDLLYLLHGMGIETGVNLDAVVAASHYLASVRGTAPASRYYAAAIATT